MADTQNKLLKTRIQLKYDTFANWTSNNPLLLKGEIAIATLTTTNAVSPNEGDTQRPVLFKVGDGTRNFNALPWASALAADVYSWAKKTEAEFKTWLNTLEFVDFSTLGMFEENDTVSLATTIERIMAAAASGVVENLGTMSDGENIEDANAELRSEIVTNIYGYDTFKIAHEKKLGTEFTGTAAAAEVNAFGSSASIKVPKLEVNEYGHVTSASEVEYKVSLPTPTDYTGAIATAKGEAIDEAERLVGELSNRVGTLPTGTTATTVVGYVDAKTANIASDERVNGIENRVKAIEDDYLTSTDRTNLTNAIGTAKGEAISEAAGDATTKANKALEDAKTYVDGKFTDANLGQYTTEQEVKDIVDKVIVDAVSDDTITGLTNLVEYLAEHGGEYAELAGTVQDHGTRIGTIEGKPAYNITSTQISNWDNEVGAKEIANSKTTTAEVKTQIEAYGYATEADLTLAEGRISTLEGKAGLEKVGTVTKVTAGTGLTGGDITETGTIALSDATIASLAKADTAIQAADLGTMAKETATNYYTKTEADAEFTNATEVNGQIDAKITALDLANTYQAKGDYATAAQGTKADTAVQPGDLATIATTGNVKDLVQDTNTYIVFDCGSSSTVI